jgi:hypothetical protein
MLFWLASTTELCNKIIIIVKKNAKNGVWAGKVIKSLDKSKSYFIMNKLIM